MLKKTHFGKPIELPLYLEVWSLLLILARFGLHEVHRLSLSNAFNVITRREEFCSRYIFEKQTTKHKKIKSIVKQLVSCLNDNEF